MTAKQLTFGSLFAGIGGLDLGFERAGMECKWQVEIDEYATKVLERHWPTVERWSDVCTWPTGTTQSVDVICGGFPCQDISVCGLGKGIEGEKSGLWSEYARIICELEPRYVVVENVPAITFRGLGTVLKDLAEAGYDAEWQCLSCWSLGSHHKRERMFVVAYRADTNRFRWQGRPFPVSEAWSHEKFTRLVRGVLRLAVPAGKRGRISDGISHRVDRLRGTGNAVVPQVAEWIGRQIVRSSLEAAR